MVEDAVVAVERKDVWASGDAYEPYVGRWSRLVARQPWCGWACRQIKTGFSSRAMKRATGEPDPMD